MRFIVRQEDMTYYYRCTESCVSCPMRFLCYTTEVHVRNGERHMKFDGFPFLDLLMVKARIAGMVTKLEMSSYSPDISLPQQCFTILG